MDMVILFINHINVLIDRVMLIHVLLDLLDLLDLLELVIFVVVMLMLFH
jgi:hypothetical protein